MSDHSHYGYAEVVITDWAHAEATRIVRQVEAERTAGLRVPAYIRQAAVTRADLPAVRDGEQRAAPVPPPAPLGVISSRWVETIPCPSPPVFDPRQYGPYLRAIGAATGTRTDLEVDGAWRLAIEAGVSA